MKVLLVALLALETAGRASALDAACHLMTEGIYAPGAPFACGAAADDVRGMDRCVLQCGLCTTPDLLYALPTATRAPLCGDPTDPSSAGGGGTFDTDGALAAATAAVMNASAAQGVYWLDDAGGAEVNASACVSHLLAYMPRRDLLRLFEGGGPFLFVDFLLEV